MVIMAMAPTLVAVADAGVFATAAAPMLAAVAVRSQ